MSGDPVGDRDDRPAQSPALEPLLSVTTEEWVALECAYRRWVEVEDPELPATPPETALSLMARGMIDEQGCLRVDSVAGVVVAHILDTMVSADLVVIIERLVGRAEEGDSSLETETQELENQELENQEPERQEPEPREPETQEPWPEADVRILHLHHSGEGSVQDILPSGIHSLSVLADPEQLATILTELLVPADAVPGTGPQRRAHPERPEELPELLGKPSVLAELTALAPDGLEDAHLIALGPGGCFTAARPPDPGPQAPIPDFVFEPVGPGWAIDWVQDLLAKRGTIAG